jgi:hypothetical protein
MQAAGLEDEQAPCGEVQNLVRKLPRQGDDRWRILVREAGEDLSNNPYPLESSHGKVTRRPRIDRIQESPYTYLDIPDETPEPEHLTGQTGPIPVAETRGYG